MKSPLRWAFGVIGVLALLASPYLYLWHYSALLVWLCIVIVGAWAFWLMMEYLRWAKSLRGK